MPERVVLPKAIGGFPVVSCVAGDFDDSDDDIYPGAKIVIGYDYNPIPWDRFWSRCGGESETIEELYIPKIVGKEFKTMFDEDDVESYAFWRNRIKRFFKDYKKIKKLTIPIEFKDFLNLPKNLNVKYI